MNLSIWDIMAPAFFECLILVGIHSYLGLHVIKRKVIFVDLALAQVAALGTTVGFLFGILPGTAGSYWFSLAFAILGAAIFSLSRFRNEKIPQEAVIGLVYAIAAAVAILVIDKSPHGAEHIKDLLTGTILWVKWTTILKAALVYAAVGLFHFIFRKKFLLISRNPEQAYKQGISVRFWDFLFYVSFGIVITHSVGTAGVLLVFVFLVVPAITSIMITDVLWKQLAIGWSMGLVVSVLGLYISYIADLPSGPTVVAFYGAMLLLAALTLMVIRAKNKAKAVEKIALGVAVTLLIAVSFSLMGQFFRSKAHPVHAVSQRQALPGKDPLIQAPLRQAAQSSARDINAQLKKTEDISEKLQLAQKLLKLDPNQGLTALTEILEKCRLPFFREEIISAIQAYSHSRFGYDPEKDTEQNAAALKKMKQWLKNKYN